MIVLSLRNNHFLVDELPKFIFAMNNLPITDDNSHGFHRRVIIIPFEKTITEENRDLNLSKKLKNEATGILNFMIAGMKRLIEKERFSQSKMIQKSLDDYNIEANNVAAFIDEYQIEATPSSHVENGELYSRYTKWCTNCGYKAVNKRNFIKRFNISDNNISRFN